MVSNLPRLAYLSLVWSTFYFANGNLSGAIGASILLCAGALLDLRGNRIVRDDALRAEITTGCEVACLLVSCFFANLVPELGATVAVPLIVRQKEVGASSSRIGAFAALALLLTGWLSSKSMVPSIAVFSETALLGLVAYFNTQQAEAVGRRSFFSVLTSQESREETTSARESELKESFRKLRNAFQELEHRTAGDRMVMRLIEWQLSEERTQRQFALAIREAVEAAGLSVYLIPESREGFVLSAWSGTARSEPRTLDMPLQSSPIILKETSAELLKQQSEGEQLHTLLLSDKGRLIGIIALHDENDERLASAVKRCEELIPLIARLVREEREREHIIGRADQAELLLQLTAKTVTGTPEHVSRTLVRDLAETLKLDGCCIFDLTGDEPKVLGQSGMNVTDLLRIGTGGIAGYIREGGGEVVITEAREDERVERTLALRKGIGMISLAPLVSSGNLVGLIASWTAEPHGISALALSTVRSLVPTIVKKVFGGYATTKPGLVDADTFWEISQGPGTFAEVDLGRRSDGEWEPELQQARKRMLAACMSTLPSGGVMTRREMGTLIVFLPGFTDVDAAKWINDLGPLVVEKFEMSVKVLALNSQSKQVFDRLTA